MEEAVSEAIEISPPPEKILGCPRVAKLTPGFEPVDGDPPGGEKAFEVELNPPPTQMLAPPV